MAEAASRAGAHLACRPGCTPCCIGPFAITALDAWRLRRGLAELAEDDPERADAVVERARSSWQALRGAFPGDAHRGVFDGDEAAEAQFCAEFAQEPCPVLDPEAGTCDLYTSRPTSCRTFGPPMRLEDEHVPPCALCFTAASPAEIERARATFDVGELEDQLEAALAARGAGGDTIVAATLAVEVGDRHDVTRA